MGQVCCGAKGENRKAGAFTSNDDESGLSEALRSEDEQHQRLSQSQQQQLLLQQQQQANQDHGGTLTSSTLEDAERIKALREEQARLEMIVSTAGRGMVNVRSTRGSTGYYDQGFAAALAQHLEQTTQFPNHLPVRLPPASTSLSTTTTSASTTSASSKSNNNNNNNNNNPKMTLYERLCQPQWETIALCGPVTGVVSSGVGLLSEHSGETTASSSVVVAAGVGENPIRFLDNVAESLLESVIPAKQQLFAGVHPMVENLL